MEVLSTLCFGQESLQPEVIQLLIESAFKPREGGTGLGTRPLTPYITKKIQSLQCHTQQHKT